MAYRIQDMLCELSVSELKEIQTFINNLIAEKQAAERANGN